MEINLNFYTILCIIGVAQGLLLSTLLFQKRRTVKANLFLSALMLFYSLYITDKTLDAADFYVQFPCLFLLFSDVTFTFGPLHYLYARKLIFPNFRFSKIQWLHFLPFFLAKAFYFIQYFSDNEKIIATLNGTNPTDHPYIFMMDHFSVIFQGLVYMFLTLILLKQHALRVKNVFSSIEKRNLKWLRVLTQLALVVWFFALFVNVLKLTINPPFITTISFIALATSLYVYVIGYLGLRQQEILFPLPADEPGQAILNKNDDVNTDKYARSGLSHEKAKKHLSDLLQLMENEKPFVNADLTLHELANKLSITSHNLSQIINTQLNQSYFDFINKYRVEEVIKALKDPSKSNYTLLSIAFDAGFNSKTSFNTIFKKHTNHTPSQYRQIISITS